MKLEILNLADARQKWKKEIEMKSLLKEQIFVESEVRSNATRIFYIELECTGRKKGFQRDFLEERMREN